ncbi:MULTISPECIES: DUF465 domain-containing protein [Pseudomonas]|uniref:DUF465 domain-containing protein n=2 Tax=Pseudomonas viridiflava TaxID=33069 RepID=A0A1Y6JM71_PSEVI|nr:MULTISPECIES: DUF465 domain-containing protein [Pseudomonas]KTC16044.1 hypothetical protein AO390_11190 [Pseudomonas marginalis ICMP 11289]MBD8572419.1 DUF465 domain-containing protein [Pseudomonas syringae]VVM96429.1 hypothetical protein PS634_03080 [Pseudomonas fluorescens]MBD8807553.1 DUF465 domain-containing protein [Pseudomonas syringae]MBI6702946.1 DUF465 domain-containing protein [Pseudomonas viridiflava]
MPVKHDLFADLSLTRDEVAERGRRDARLQQLLNDYESADVEVLNAEKGSAGGIGDDALRTLKEKRLLVKDRIVQRLSEI